MKAIVSPIALLGTSADPPTYGHQALLKGLSELFPKVITWASDNPMKTHSASLSQRHRLLRALVKDLAIPHLEVRQELSNPKTIKTLETAHTAWPEAEIILIIGSDLAGQIPSWFQAKKVLTKARLAIAPREGWPLTKNSIKKLKNMGAMIDVLPLSIPATASSEVRDQLETTQIPKSILPIIIEENLYGLPSKR